MANSRAPHFHRDPFQRPALTPGPLGHNDAASPDTRRTHIGDTPGPLGINDHASPFVVGRDPNITEQSRIISSVITPKPGTRNQLREEDFVDAAKTLGGASVAVIKAFAEVESGGKSGFGSDGLPVIAYEGHIFRRLTKRLHDRHMRLSYVYLEKAGAQWKLNNRSHSVSWQTLRAAMELDANAALQSCSWGKFQIMGFNHKACGFENVLDFVMAMKTGEREQLMGFVKFCKSRSDLISAIMAKDFKKIACLYNGVNYGDYDKRMERSYKKHCNAASSSPKT